MNMKLRGMSLVIVIALLVPIFSIGMQNITDKPLIWIVYTESPDESMTLAAQTFRNEMVSAGCIIRETTLDQVNSIPEHSDAIALVGHGTEAGIFISDGIMSWDSLYDTIQKRNPLHILSLACYSPTNPENGIFGFMGEIDAEAGAIIGTWHISRVLDLNEIDSSLYIRAAEAQKALNHPLSRVIYFVHGYFGDPSDFDDIKNYLDVNSTVPDEYDEYCDFSYFNYYQATTWAEKDLLHWNHNIFDFAQNFADYLISNHEPGTQINIVTHSLGGIITREMLALRITSLESAGIDIGTVITIATPNQGTFLADPVNLAVAIAALFALYPNLYFWPSPVYWSVHPWSPLITNLNADPMSYSEGIRWYTAAGIDLFWGGLLAAIHGEYSDPLVGESRAKLAFAIESPTFVGLEHSALLHQTNGTFPSIGSWLLADSDSDNDGIKDSLEVYRYNTDPFDSDSDNDGLLDGAEVYTYNTNPLAWSTDGDILSDSQEIAWGYDPNNTDSPIDAQYLTYSAWQVSGIGKVRANHYSAMDYVKVYVRYKNSLGYWTGDMLAGTDYTPYYYGDYYVDWSLLSGYVQMLVTVKAYDSANHYLGCDQAYVTLPGDGGGGGGGDPLPE
jgi:hypothetical protein